LIWDLSFLSSRNRHCILPFVTANLAAFLGGRQMQAGTPLYGTTREVAERFSISESTLEKLRLTGGGPIYIKRGRSVRYAFGDVEQWLAAHRRTNTSRAA
jgi:hypothetical protein